MARTVLQVQNDINHNGQQRAALDAELKQALAVEAAKPKAGQIFRFRSKYYGGQFSHSFYLAVSSETAVRLAPQQIVAPNVVYGVSLDNGSYYGFSLNEYELEMVAGKL
jgi:hypothetical protein